MQLNIKCPIGLSIQKKKKPRRVLDDRDSKITTPILVLCDLKNIKKKSFVITSKH